MPDLHPAARELVDALVAKDDERPRTQQTKPGFSSLGDCARKVWHVLREDAPCNPNVERLPSILGTAIHGVVESIWAPPQKLSLPEIDLEGTPDRIHGGVLDDYKTTSLKNVEWVMENGPSRGQRWQIHTYAFAWNLQPPEPRGNELPLIHTVRLIYIPRDGRSTDIHVHEEPYDKAVALEAIDWYRSLKDMVSLGYEPKPEKAASFCARFCQFYGDLCPGLTKDDVDMAVDRDDPWCESAAATYKRGTDLIKQGEALKKQAHGVLDGAVGRYGPWKVTPVHVAPKEEPDAKAMAAELEMRGIPVPTRKKAGYSYPKITAVKAEEKSDAD